MLRVSDLRNIETALLFENISGRIKAKISCGWVVISEWSKEIRERGDRGAKGPPTASSALLQPLVADEETTDRYTLSQGERERECCVRV